MRSNPFPLLLPLLLLSACAAEADTRQEALKQTRAALASYIQGHYDKDPVRAAGIYAEDAVIIGENGEAFTSREDIERYYRFWYQSTSVDQLNVEMDEFEMLGTSAYEMGTTSLTYREGAIDPDSLHFYKTRYLTIWEKDPEGAWKIKRGISVAILAPSLPR